MVGWKGDRRVAILEDVLELLLPVVVVGDGVDGDVVSWNRGDRRGVTEAIGLAYDMDSLENVCPRRVVLSI